MVRLDSDTKTLDLFALQICNSYKHTSCEDKTFRGNMMKQTNSERGGRAQEGDIRVHNPRPEVVQAVLLDLNPKPTCGYFVANSLIDA